MRYVRYVRYTRNIPVLPFVPLPTVPCRYTSFLTVLQVRVEQKIAELTAEGAGMEEAVAEWGKRLRAKSKLHGARRVYAVLLQHIHWRRWQDLRANKMLAMTVMRATRPSGKKHRELAFRRHALLGLQEVGNARSRPT